MTTTTKFSITESDPAANAPQLSPSCEPAPSSSHQSYVNTNEYLHKLLRTELWKPPRRVWLGKWVAWKEKSLHFAHWGHKVQTLPEPFPRLSHLFFLLNPSVWTKSVGPTSHRAPPGPMQQDECGTACDARVPQQWNLTLNTPWFLGPVCKITGQRTMLNLASKTTGVQSAKSRKVQNYRTSESFNSTNSCKGKKMKES